MNMSISSHRSATGTVLLSRHLRMLPEHQASDGSQHSPLIKHFGRIVEGIDLAQASLSTNPDLRTQIVAAVYEHGLVVFRNQSHLTPQDEIAFAKLFTHQPSDVNASQHSYTGGAGTQHRLPGHPSIALVGSYSVRDYHGLTASSPGVYNNWDPDQRAWHCDGLADTHPPPDLTTMRCIKTPSCGGETLFACSVKAAQLLPTKSLVDEYGVHPEDVNVNYKLFSKYKIAMEGTHLTSAEGAKGNTSEGGWNVNLSDGTTVPLVIRERHTGKRSLVGTYHVASISNRTSSAVKRTQQPSLDFRESNAYLAEAWRPGLSDENVYKHQWQVGDLAAWSNRLVIHTATSTRVYEGQERLHTRIRMRSQEEYAPVAWKEDSARVHSCTS